jgi:hypothetical protein
MPRTPRNQISEKSKTQGQWSQNRTRPYQMNVMLTDGERAELISASDRAGVAMSSWVRMVALERARGEA